MTEEGKRRISEAQKKRWAEKNATDKKGPRKRTLTAEGRASLAENMRKRWAIKRTAGQAKKRGRKAKTA